MLPQDLDLNEADLKELTLEKKIDLLYTACARGNPNLAQKLLDDPNINSADINWNVLFKFACTGKNIEIAKLLYKKVDVTYRDGAGNTLLHLACKSGFNEIVEQFLTNETTDVNAQNQDGHTPLHLACIANNYPLVKLLKEQPKTDVTYVDNEGNTCLHVTCNNDSQEIIELLLKDPRIEVNKPNNKGMTATQLNFHRSKIKNIKAFLQDPNNSVHKEMADLKAAIVQPNADIEKWFHTKEVSFIDGGHSYSFSHYILYLSLSAGVKLSPAQFKVPEELKNIANAKIEFEQSSIGDVLKGYTLWKTLGRSLIYKKNDSDQIIVVKCQKKKETLQQLNTEKVINNFLKEKDQKSPHDPLGMFEVDLTNLALNDEQSNVFYDLVGEDKKNQKIFAYVYTITGDDYLTYLHDENLTDEEFFQSTRIITHDLVKYYVKYGLYFNQLADLFHNSEDDASSREDAGRCHMFPALSRDLDLLLFAGNGRLTSWIRAVIYLNLRRFTIADAGDFITLPDYLDKDNHFTKKAFGEVFELFPEDATNILFANSIGEYLYTQYLAGGLRAHKIQQAKITTAIADAKDESSQAVIERVRKECLKEIWHTIAENLVDNASYTVHQFTGIPEYIARRTLVNMIGGKKGIDYLARQMQYWMTDEYIEDIKNNKRAEDVYPPDTDVKLKFNDLRPGSFKDIGFSIDGINPDLGPVNGQEPVKKQFELISATLVLAFTLFNVKPREGVSQFNTNPIFNLLPTPKTELSARKVVDEKTQTITIYPKKEISEKAHTGILRLQMMWLEKKHREGLKEKYKLSAPPISKPPTVLSFH